MRIGELARKTDVPVRTIRYYEDIGLLEPASRTTSGYRLFTEIHQRRLVFIRMAQGLGLKLEQIKVILDSADGDQPRCPRVRAAVEQNIQEVDERIALLQAMRRNLARTLNELDKSDYSPAIDAAGFCPAIESPPARAPKPLDSPVDWRL